MSEVTLLWIKNILKKLWLCLYWWWVCCEPTFGEMLQRVAFVLEKC